MDTLGVKNSFGKMGLKPDEDKKLKELIKARGITLAVLQRMLMREWISKGGPGFVFKTEKVKS